MMLIFFSLPLSVTPTSWIIKRGLRVTSQRKGASWMKTRTSVRKNITEERSFLHEDERTENFSEKEHHRISFMDEEEHLRRNIMRRNSREGTS